MAATLLIRAFRMELMSAAVLLKGTRLRTFRLVPFFCFVLVAGGFLPKAVDIFRNWRTRRCIYSGWN